MVHTVPDVSLLLLVPGLQFLIQLISSLLPSVEAGRKGQKCYSRITIFVVSWPVGIFLALSEDFVFALYILSPWCIRWKLSPLSNYGVLSLPLLHKLSGVVLFAGPPLCGPPPIIPHSL